MMMMIVSYRIGVEDAGLN